MPAPAIPLRTVLTPSSELQAQVECSHAGSWLQLLRPFDFEWTNVRLPVPNLPAGLSGFRIIHLTDLHLRGPWYEVFDRLLARIREANADLLLFTGDFVDNKKNHAPALPAVRRMAEGFSSKLGTYAILGNHDRLHFAPRLRETPVELISGELRKLKVGGATVELVGLPGAKRKELPADFADGIPPAGENTMRVVLSHFPDHLPRTLSLRPDLFLAGHTHGGQVCLPGRIPIIKHDRLPRKYCHGVHRVADTWLIANRGFGYTSLPVRVFCPPEVIEIELVGVE